MIKYKLKSESILYLYFFTTTTADHSTFVIYEVQVPRHQIRGSNKIKKNMASVKSQRSLVPWTRPNPPPRQLGTHLVWAHTSLNARRTRPSSPTSSRPSHFGQFLLVAATAAAWSRTSSLPPPPSRWEPPEP
jgi:hypothetical protein